MIEETTLYGSIISLGSDVKLQTLDGRVVTCTGQTTDLEIGRISQFQGYLQWSDDDRIVGFEILAELQYLEAPLTESFEELRGLVGQQFDLITDVNQFVQDMR